MKYWFVGVLSFCLIYSGFAQDTTATMNVEKNEVSIAVPDADGSAKRQDQIIIDVNYEHLLDLPDGVDLKLWSRGINLYMMYDIPIADANVSFAIGAGFSSQNYFSNSFVVRDTADFSSFLPVEDSLDIKRTKLSTNFVDVPIEFRFRSNANSKGNRWKIALGGKVGYLMNVHSKYIASNGDKFKGYVFPNVRQLRYGVHTRIGYGRWSLTGFYSLSTLFEDKKGVEVTPLSMGISIIPF